MKFGWLYDHQRPERKKGGRGGGGGGGGGGKKERKKFFFFFFFFFFLYFATGRRKSVHSQFKTISTLFNLVRRAYTLPGAEGILAMSYLCLFLKTTARMFSEKFQKTATSSVRIAQKVSTLKVQCRLVYILSSVGTVLKYLTLSQWTHFAPFAF